MARDFWVPSSEVTSEAARGVAAALLAVVGAPWVPQDVADRLGGESVEQILTILASSLLAWIDRLSSLAQVGHMVAVVEKRTCEALTDRRRRPFIRGREGVLKQGALVAAGSTGYVHNVDPQRLQAVAEALDCDVQVIAQPGAFVRRGEPLARISLPICEDDVRKQFVSAFALGPTRSFDQDPRFGLIVLGEIATRALSPGVNDPGTAMQVIGVGVRLLDDWARTAPDQTEDQICSRILAPGIEPDDLLSDVMDPIARHGAADPAVMIRLRKAFWSLADGADIFEPAVRRMDEHLLARCRQAVAYKPDLTTIEKAAPCPKLVMLHCTIRLPGGARPVQSVGQAARRPHAFRRDDRSQWTARSPGELSGAGAMAGRGAA